MFVQGHHHSRRQLTQDTASITSLIAPDHLHLYSAALSRLPSHCVDVDNQRRRAIRGPRGNADAAAYEIRNNCGAVESVEAMDAAFWTVADVAGTYVTKFVRQHPFDHINDFVATDVAVQWHLHAWSKSHH